MTTSSLRPGHHVIRNVLLVEDNPADVYVTNLALSKVSVPINVYVVADGEDAVSLLRKQGNWKDTPRPDLVLLDLNLPRKSGREVLAEIRADKALRRIPVAVLTSSQADTDLLQVYDLGANVCFTKPSDPDLLVKIIVSVAELWFVLGQLPPE